MTRRRAIADRRDGTNEGSLEKPPFGRVRCHGAIRAQFARSSMGVVYLVLLPLTPTSSVAKASEPPSPIRANAITSLLEDICFPPSTGPFPSKHGSEMPEGAAFFKTDWAEKWERRRNWRSSPHLRS